MNAQTTPFFILTNRSIGANDRAIIYHSAEKTAVIILTIVLRRRESTCTAVDIHRGQRGDEEAFVARNKPLAHDEIEFAKKKRLARDFPGAGGGGGDGERQERCN